MSIEFILSLISGLAVGIVFGWAFWGRQAKNINETRNQLSEYSNQNENLLLENVKLKTEMESEKKASEEKLKDLIEAREELSNAFDALAKRALASNNEEFMRLAKSAFEKLQSDAKGDLEQRKQAVESLVKPLQDSLKEYNEEVKKLRVSEGSLLDQVKSLQSETETLSRALRQPQVKGRWGEYTLRRVVELAGMSEYCDFDEQTSVETDEGRKLRPDMKVALPGNKLIVVDAKTPLTAYLEAMETTDEVKRNKLMKDHARLVRQQVKNLGEKSYWEQFPITPDFAVMFIPGEHFLSAALKEAPNLFEEAVEKRVLLSTPVTFIALMKTIALTWRQKDISQNANRISTLAKDLHDRLFVFSDHLQKVGLNLDKSVKSYNSAVSSFESRVLVSARKFKDMGVTVRDNIPQVEPRDSLPRLPDKNL